MKVREGQVAPDFDMLDIYGRRVRLGDYRGRSVLVTFNRAAVCPLCNLRVAHLIRRYPAYHRAGLDVIAFFESSPQRAHQYLDRQRAPFPIVADLGREVYSRYGLESSLFGALWALLTRRSMYREAARLNVGGGMVANLTAMDGRMGGLPGDFLVGPDGRTRLSYYGRDAGDFLLFRDLELAAFGARVPEEAYNPADGLRR
ncbi:MAG TPA: peroxiredoxin-like family protein [Ktedonobacterales bacterium]